VRLARDAAIAGAHALARRPGLVVFVAAMLPRLVFLAQLRAHSPTFWLPEGGDSMLYDRIASGAPEPLRAYFHSPLYIGLLSGAYKLFGRDLLVVRLLQHVLGAASCVLVHWVTLRVFHSRSAALLAGLAAAATGPVLFYEGQIGVDGVMPFLVMACVALVVRASLRGRAVDWALVGLALGVAALGRAVVLVWLPVLLLWALMSRPPLAARLRAASGLLLGAALVIAPLTIRNYVVEKDFVLISANGGINLFIGNNPRANGAYIYPPGVDFRPGNPFDDFEGRGAAEESEGHPMTSAQVSSWWSKRAWQFIESHPDRTAALAFEKAKLLVSDAEYMQLQDYEVYREVAPVLGVLPRAGLLVVLGLAGLAMLANSEKRHPLGRRVAVLMLLFAAGFLPFFVVGRYRTPWLLLLAPFAGFAIVQMGRALRSRAWDRAAIAAVAAMAMLWVTTRPLDFAPGAGFQYMSFARAALRSGDRPAGEHWCERATARDPRAIDAATLLARLWREDRRYDDAERVASQALARFPRDPGALLELGRVRLETGRVEAAIGALQASVDGDPRSLEAWSALAGALHAAGREEDAQTASRSLAMLRGTGPT
jgi:4-amino-4-deoxy-L-arabinose transferase-like glycosyltransferase